MIFSNPIHQGKWNILLELWEKMWVENEKWRNFGFHKETWNCFIFFSQNEVNYLENPKVLQQINFKWKYFFNPTTFFWICFFIPKNNNSKFFPSVFLIKLTFENLKLFNPQIVPYNQNKESYEQTVLKKIIKTKKIGKMKGFQNEFGKDLVLKIFQFYHLKSFQSKSVLFKMTTENQEILQMTSPKIDFSSWSYISNSKFFILREQHGKITVILRGKWK